MSSVRLFVVSIFLVAAFTPGSASSQVKAPAKRVAAQSVQRPAPQKYGDHLEIQVTGIKEAKTWSMFPGMSGAPGIAADPGQTLILVEFQVKDLASGKEDTDASFDGFELEDTVGQKHACSIKRSDVREIPFVVPEGTRPKVFRISGLSFAVESLGPKNMKP
ncbi:MAG TPA: hypothetical protein VF135_13800 [Terriglobales bacterium]